MAKTKITLPWGNFNGNFAGFHFANSVHVTGLAPNDMAVQRCKLMLGGTTVEEVIEPAASAAQGVVEPPAPPPAEPLPELTPAPVDPKFDEAVAAVMKRGYAKPAAEKIVLEHGGEKILASIAAEAEQKRIEEAAAKAAQPAQQAPAKKISVVKPAGK